MTFPTGLEAKLLTISGLLDKVQIDIRATPDGAEYLVTADVNRQASIMTSTLLEAVENAVTLATGADIRPDSEGTLDTRGEARG